MASAPAMTAHMPDHEAVVILVGHITPQGSPHVQYSIWYGYVSCPCSPPARCREGMCFANHALRFFYARIAVLSTGTECYVAAYLGQMGDFKVVPLLGYRRGEDKNTVLHETDRRHGQSLSVRRWAIYRRPDFHIWALLSLLLQLLTCAACACCHRQTETQPCRQSFIQCWHCLCLAHC